MRSRRRAALHLGLAAVFAVAWRYNVLLVVVAMLAAAIAIVVRERFADLDAARRAAALALHTPAGINDASSLEEMIAADLAAVAGDDVDALVEARALAEKTLADPWRRALAVERLDLAVAYARRSVIPPPTTLAVLRRPTTLVMAAAGALGLVALSAWIGTKLTLVPLALPVAVLALADGERRCRRSTQHALAGEAAAHPAVGSVVVPEAAIIGAIETITDSRPRVRRIAASFVAASPEPNAERGTKRLHAVADPPRRLSLAEHGIAVWATAATILTLLIGR